MKTTQYKFRTDNHLSTSLLSTHDKREKWEWWGLTLTDIIIVHLRDEIDYSSMRMKKNREWSNRYDRGRERDRGEGKWAKKTRHSSSLLHYALIEVEKPIYHFTKREYYTHGIEWWNL